MLDIWNPWHGCVNISEGCANCYMYFLDKKNGKDGAVIYRSKNNFDYPLKKNRQGEYKIKSGEMIRVAMTSDFFLEQADPWRDEAWKIMEARSDVIFFLLTKRAQRINECLPESFQNGQWDMANIFINVSCENQRLADLRIPYLLKVPIKHKGIMAAPFIGPIKIEKYLATNLIEQVICGGENYGGARVCDFDWVRDLGAQCRDHQVKFAFIETGSLFCKDGQRYKIAPKAMQSRLAYKSKASLEGKKITFDLHDVNKKPIPEGQLHVPHYRETCRYCGSRSICNGCSDCGRCHGEIITQEQMKIHDQEYFKKGAKK